MEITDQPPPRGFQITTSDRGDCVIRYRTTGMGCLGFFLLVWLTGWTVACVALTFGAIFNQGGLDYILFVLMVPFWGAEILVLGFFIWYYGSTSTFAFERDQLMVERSLFRYQRRRFFPRSEISAIKQIKDGGEGEDSFPSWGLVIVTGSQVVVLSRQPMEKSDWLGAIIANWAQVSFDPAETRKYEMI